MTDDAEHLPWLASYAPGVPASIDVPDEPLTASLERSVAEHGDRPALEFLGRTTSYASLGRKVDQAAGLLYSRGVRHGSRVALVIPNCPQHMVAFYAVLRLGAIVVECNPLYTRPQLAHQFDDSRPDVIVVWDKSTAVTREALRDIKLDASVFAVTMPRELPRVKQRLIKLPLPATRRLRASMTTVLPPGIERWEDAVRNAPGLPDGVDKPNGSDIALLQYTGGTTGTPKGAIITHRNLVANSLQSLAWLPAIRPGHETMYGALPFFHAFGITFCLAVAIRAAALLVLFPTFDPDMVLDAQRRAPGTLFPGVPPMFDRVARRAQERRSDLSTFSFAFAGAMPLDPDLVERWESVAGGARLIEGYGLTECSPVVAGSPLTDARRPGTLGLPFPSTRIRIGDPEDLSRDMPIGEAGELLVSGPQVFSGYWNAEEETASSFTQDGWLRTGDIACMDEDGFFTMMDRLKEIIITGGFNVYPSQVEEVLAEMPGVADVAVVGIPMSAMGERVVAAVVPEDGVHIDLDAVRQWSSEKLARYAIPKDLVIVKDLPRSMLGKTLRREIRNRIIDRPDAHSTS